MSVRPARLLPVLALTLVALLAVPAGALGAKTRVERPQQYIWLSVKGTNGWNLSIGGATGGQFKKPFVSVDASGPSRLESVSYSVHGHITADGTIDAKLPGIGRVSVVFEKTKTEAIEFTAPGCRVEGKARTLKGVFRGTIKLRGGGGFTTVDRTSARGEIREAPRLTCAVKKEHPTPAEERRARESHSHTTELWIGRKLFGGELSFEASYSDPGYSLIPGHGLNFWASYTKIRHGLMTMISVHYSGHGQPNAFTFAAPNGEPSEATVEPPAPFAGSGVFKLESPTTASWTGDLRVAMPTLGAVSLTGPTFWKALCRGTTCTKTPPPGIHVQFIGGFFE